MILDTSHDIRHDESFILIEVTGYYLPVAPSGWAGTYLYAWKQKYFDSSSGLTVDAAEGKFGIADPPITYPPGPPTPPPNVPERVKSPAVEVSNKLVPIGTITYARQRGNVRNQLIFEFEFGTGEEGFYARLVSKTFDGPCPHYIARPVTRDPIKCGEEWDEEDVDWQAIEVNGVDLPCFDEQEDPPPPTDNLGTIVWLTPISNPSGSGFFAHFTQPPRWEFVRKTGDIDEFGFFSGLLLRYDQPTDEIVNVRDVYILDMNGGV